MSGAKGRKLCFVVSAPFALNPFLRPHLIRLSVDYEVTVCVNQSGKTPIQDLPSVVRVVHVPIAREINMVSDARCLVFLTSFFRREQFDLVFSLTPKAGLLAMLAGFVARVPRRVHCFTGQVWAIQSGLRRIFLQGMDRFLAACASSLLADSASQRNFLLDQRVVPASKIRVLANGSIAGVDLSRFHPDMAIRQLIRQDLGISEDAVCILFVGRLKREKGILDLLLAFDRCRSGRKIQLLLVGPDEDGLAESFSGQEGVHLIGYSDKPEHYMLAADVFCLPSYREGFGSVLIEAAAVGIPAIASNIYGVTDAVVDGETGLLHPPGNVEELERLLALLSDDVALRHRLGNAAKVRAQCSFSSSTLTEAMAVFIGQEIAG